MSLDLSQRQDPRSPPSGVRSAASRPSAATAGEHPSSAGKRRVLTVQAGGERGAEIGIGEVEQLHRLVDHGAERRPGRHLGQRQRPARFAAAIRAGSAIAAEHDRVIDCGFVGDPGVSGSELTSAS